MVLTGNNTFLLKTGSVIGAVSAILFHCMNFNSNPSGVLTGSIQGCVVNALNNRPVPYAAILLVGGSAMTVTDTNGIFRLSDIPSGTHMLIVKKAHFISQEVAVLVQTNALSQTDTTSLSVDFGMLSGVVRDAISGSPVQNANILLFAVYDTTVRDGRMTDDNGYFTFDTVCAIDGGYRSIIDKQGYQQRSFLHKINRGDSIFITEDLRPFVTKTFFVYDSATKALLSQAYVRHDGGVVQSDAQGRAVVTIAALPDSGCLFQAWAAHYDTLSFRDTIATNEVAIDSLPLQRQGGCLIGTVRCQGQLHHAGAVVQLSTVASDTTDSLGNFIFSNVRAGAYPVAVSMPDFTTWTDMITIPGRDTAIASAELVIRAGMIETSVAWDADGSPYSIDDTLTVVDNGVLSVGAGAEIRMANGSLLSTSGNGIIITAGTSWDLVRICSDGASGSGARMEIQGSIDGTAMMYTLVQDIKTIFHDGPFIDHCLFVYTDDFFPDTSVYVRAGDYGTVFDHCDFIRKDTDVQGVYVQDSLYTGGEEGGSVTFSNCIFSQFASPTANSPCVTSDNTGNIAVYMKNGNVYADGSGADPMFDIAHMDTSSVGQIDPGYDNIGQGDYCLKKESALLDKSMTHDFLGALGLVAPHPERR